MFRRLTFFVLFFQSLIPFSQTIVQNITHDNNTDYAVHPVYNDVSSLHETTTLTFDEKMSSDIDDYFETVSQNDTYLQHESKLNVKRKKFIKRFKEKPRMLWERPDESYKYGSGVEEIRLVEKNNLLTPKPTRKTLYRGEAGFVTELFRYIATLTETDEDYIVGEEYGSTRSYNDITMSGIKDELKTSTDNVYPNNQQFSVKDDQQKVDTPTRVSVKKKIKYINQIEASSTDKYTPIETGVPIINKGNKIRRQETKFPAFVKIDSFSIKNGSLLNQKQTTDSNIVKTHLSSSPSLQGEIKKTYCVWINGTQHCNNSFYKPAVEIQERSSFDSSAKKRESEKRTFGSEENISKNVSKFAITFSDSNSSKTGTKFKSSFNNLPIIISIVLNKTHSEERNTKEKINSDSKYSDGKYPTGSQDNNLNRNGSLYQFGTLYDDYVNNCEVISTGVSVYHGQLCIYMYCVIVLLNVTM